MSSSKIYFHTKAKPTPVNFRMVKIRQSPYIFHTEYVQNILYTYAPLHIRPLFQREGRRVARIIGRQEISPRIMFRPVLGPHIAVEHLESYQFTYFQSFQQGYFIQDEAVEPILD